MDSGRKTVKITKHQKEILDLCRDEVDAGRGFPTLREISKRLGKNESTTSGVRNTLMALAKKGLVTYEEGRGCGIILEGARRSELIQMLRSLVANKPMPDDTAWIWAEKLLEKTR